MNPPSNFKGMQGRTSLEDKWVCVVIRGNPIAEHGVVELNGVGEVSSTNESSENGIPSEVGLVGQLIEGEKRVTEATQVDIDIDKL